MTTGVRRFARLTAFLSSVGLLSHTVRAEDAAPTVSPAIKEAMEHVARFELSLAPSGPDERPGKRLSVCSRPLLTFGDPARANEAGTLWIWSDGGRPFAAMELYRESAENSPWVHAWTLTSPLLVAMKTARGDAWAPTQADFAVQGFPEHPAVAAQPAARLRQMKDMARRLAGHEFWDPDNSRFELRLLETPVHRYADEDHQILDGALFVFAHGTNPEVLLLLEAVGSEGHDARWQASFSRLGSAELHIELGERKLWSRDCTPGVIGTAKDPYHILVMPRNNN